MIFVGVSSAIITVDKAKLYQLKNAQEKTQNKRYSIQVVVQGSGGVQNKTLNVFLHFLYSYDLASIDVISFAPFVNVLAPGTCLATLKLLLTFVHQCN